MFQSVLFSVHCFAMIHLFIRPFFSESIQQVAAKTRHPIRHISHPTSTLAGTGNVLPEEYYKCVSIGVCISDILIQQTRA